jgi:DNA-binding response OmpR family regulator
MLVCSTSADEVERCLRSAAGEIVKVSDGEDAIHKAQHATFNMAVLVSTGKTMDIAETVFNLRDISYWLPILIIDEPQGGQESQAQIIAHASPNTRAVTLQDLRRILA